MHGSISPLAAATLWFAGGFLALFNTFSRFDVPSNHPLSSRPSALFFRAVAFLIGASFGVSLCLALIPVALVVVVLLNISIDLELCMQIATLVCLLSAVVASSLLFVGRWMNRGAAVFSVLFSLFG